MNRYYLIDSSHADNKLLTNLRTVPADRTFFTDCIHSALTYHGDSILIVLDNEINQIRTVLALHGIQSDEVFEKEFSPTLLDFIKTGHV